jgi:hypothetical protein
MRTRRGLSTVVGMVFAIIALTTTITYITYSMNTLDQYNQAVLSRNQQTLNQNQEKFQVTSAVLFNNKFNITITNTGTLPINFTKLWIQNTTASDKVYQYVPVTKVVAPGATLKNIGQSIPCICTFTAAPAYHIKLVTSRGNTQEFNMNTGTNGQLFVQISVLPKSVVPNYYTTVLYTVTNNQTGNNILNLTPQMQITGAAGDVALVGSAPSPYPSLMSGSSVTFKWNYLINGITGDTITFTTSLQGAPASDTVSDSVTVQDVQFASQSKTTLSANGLASSGPSDSLLYLHQETYNVPAGANKYQMHSGQPDTNNKFVIQLDTTSPSFYTVNDTLSAPVIIPAGKWNATLRYMSAPVPHTFSSGQYPDLTYHFADGSNPSQILDSSGNTENLVVSSTKPSYNAASGPNSTGAYTFAGSSGTPQYFAHSTTSNSDLHNYGTASTAGWFKTSGSVTTKQDIVRFGDKTSSPFWEISVLNHVMVFSHSNQKTGGVDVTCTGTRTVDNQQWHHFVAMEPQNGKCTMYVDGIQDPASTQTGTACSGASNAQCTAISNNWDIGRDPSVVNGQYYFQGTIDDIMHWNNYVLSSAQVTDLLKTSYGNNAQQLAFTISLTDNAGGSPVTIVQSGNMQWPFADSFGDYNSAPDSSLYWGHFNYTVNLASQSVASQQRLMFQIQYPSPPANGRIDTKMLIDSTDLIDQYKNTLLQIPTPNQPLPGYYTYASNADGTVSVYNSGPYQAWLTPNSRVTFEDFHGGTDYASWIASFQGDCHDNNCWVSDSTLLPVGGTTQITFSIPHTQPGIDQSSQGTKIPAGNYRMYVYLNGYDQRGNFITGTQYIGSVKVT